LVFSSDRTPEDCCTYQKEGGKQKDTKIEARGNYNW
jgi:hypothetical protein